jgi:predicted nucleic acid-binding protein
MIYLDTNIFLRFFVKPTDPEGQRRSKIAETLIRRVANNEVNATITEVVLHELAYTLGSRKQYGKSPEFVHSRLKFIVELPGLRLSRDDRYCYGRALELLEQLPKIEFSDAILAARTEYRDSELATFDRHFDAIDSVRKWNPDPTETTE